jgi:hypothetical protein
MKRRNDTMMIIKSKNKKLKCDIKYYQNSTYTEKKLGKEIILFQFSILSNKILSIKYNHGMKIQNQIKEKFITNSNKKQ